MSTNVEGQFVSPNDAKPLVKRRFINVYKDGNGRYISDEEYSSLNEANKNKDNLSTYIETVEINGYSNLIDFLQSKRYTPTTIKSVNRQYAYGVTDLINDVLDFIHNGV